MIDLHTHTVFSDGALIPFELARRAEAIGYRALAFTDHVDASNMDFVIPRIIRAIGQLRGKLAIKLIAGVELTHVPPSLMAGMIEEARGLGAELVVVHGESLVEPVAEGTNRAAIEGGCDILAHPGLISPDEVRAAGEKGVVLEISARKGHSLGNGHVAKLAKEYGVPVVINTDAHEPSDLITEDMAAAVLRGAGLAESSIQAVFATSLNIVERITGRKNA